MHPLTITHPLSHNDSGLSLRTLPPQHSDSTSDSNTLHFFNKKGEKLASLPNTEECAICLAELNDIESGHITLVHHSRLNSALHLFHEPCIKRVLEQSNECPLCRITMTKLSIAEQSTLKQAHPTDPLPTTTPNTAEETPLAALNLDDDASIYLITREEPLEENPPTTLNFVKTALFSTGISLSIGWLLHEDAGWTFSPVAATLWGVSGTVLGVLYAGSFNQYQSMREA